jgi:hypothetical protein
VKADNDSNGRQRHARLGSGLQRGRTRVGDKRQRRHRVALTAVEVEDGGGGQRWRQTTTTAMADDNNGNGGQQQQQTITAVDNNGMQDRAADYKGKGGERMVNNNGITARRIESVKK